MTTPRFHTEKADGLYQPIPFLFVTRRMCAEILAEREAILDAQPAATRKKQQALFEEAYFARFRVRLPEIRARLVNLNTSVIGERPDIDLSVLIDPTGRLGSVEATLVETRPVWFDGGFRDTPVYAREKLPADAAIEGPAILEQLDCTTVLEPRDRARGDADGNIIIEVGS